MPNARIARTGILAAVVLLPLFTFAPARAHAANKDIIALQTQVQQLLDMVQRLQSTLDTKFGVIQNLVEQTSDQTNRMTAAVNNLQQSIAAQNAALSGKLDSTSGEVQSVSDSVEELKARLDKLQTSVQNLQTQLQNIQTPPQPAPGAATPPGAPGASATGPAANPAPPLQDTYQAALSDFNRGHYDVAQGEFQEIIQYYPQDDLAGNSQFYLGEIAYRQQKWDDAIKNYNAMMETFPTGSKAPAAQLHKGFALLRLNRRSSGIAALRSLIQKHPRTPEAAQARERLNGMGVRINPGH
ncbi:MAG: tol-pal system protein YbgF [Acidobacteriota bacterium]